jgi:hypothetical protein
MRPRRLAPSTRPTVCTPQQCRQTGQLVRASKPPRPGVARRLKLGHDHGSDYVSADFQGEIECLAIEASPSFVLEPEGKGVAETLHPTRKKTYCG